MSKTPIHDFFEDHIGSDRYVRELLPVVLLAIVVPIAALAVGLLTTAVFEKPLYAGNLVGGLMALGIGGAVLYYWAIALATAGGALVYEDFKTLRGGPQATRAVVVACGLALVVVAGWFLWSVHLVRADHAGWLCLVIFVPGLAPFVAALGLKPLIRVFQKGAERERARAKARRAAELAALAGLTPAQLEAVALEARDAEKQRRAIALLTDAAALKRLARNATLANGLRLEAAGRLSAAADLRELFFACPERMDIQKRCVERLSDSATLAEIAGQETRAGALVWFKDKPLNEAALVALLERGRALPEGEEREEVEPLLDAWVDRLEAKESILALLAHYRSHWPELQARAEALLTPADLREVSSGEAIALLAASAADESFALALLDHPALSAPEWGRIARESDHAAVVQACLSRMDEDACVAIAEETWSAELRSRALARVQDQAKLKTLAADPKGRCAEVIARIEDQAFLEKLSGTLPRIPALHAALAEAIREPRAKAGAQLNAAIAQAVTAYSEVLAKEEKAVARGGLATVRGGTRSACGGCKKEVGPLLDQCPHCMAVFSNVEPCYAPAPNPFPKLTQSLRQLVICGTVEPQEEPTAPAAGLGRRALFSVLALHYHGKDDTLSFPNAYERPRSGKLLLSTRSSWEADGIYLNSRWLEFTRVSFARFTMRYYETSRLD